MSVQVGSWASAGKPYRIAAFVTAALCLFGGWGYLYVKSRAVDLRVATEALASLRELKEADSRWNDWLIGMRLSTGAGTTAGTETRANTRPVFSGGTLFRSNFETVVFDGWKYIRSATTGREELFRLADDPAERRSLVLDFPEVAARGRALVDEDARASRVFRELRGIENPVIKLDADEIARLRALGYL